MLVLNEEVKVKQNDFGIYEDGVLQRIAFFSQEETLFNLILLVDLSGREREDRSDKGDGASFYRYNERTGPRRGHNLYKRCDDCLAPDT